MEWLLAGLDRPLRAAVDLLDVAREGARADRLLLRPVRAAVRGPARRRVVAASGCGPGSTSWSGWRWSSSRSASSSTRRGSLLFNPKVIASNELEAYFRVNSLFFDPNIYGRFLALVMLGLAAVLLWERRPRTVVARHRGARRAVGRPAADALAVELRRAAVRALRARGAALPAGARSCRSSSRRRRSGSCSCSRSRPRCGSTSATPSSLDDATSGRYELIRGGIDLARDRPVWGFGSGSFADEYLAHGFGARSDAVSASHTIPLTVAAEQGLIGLARLSRAAGRGAVAAARRRARRPLRGRSSRPASSPSWCTRGCTRRSSRTR